MARRPRDDARMSAVNPARSRASRFAPPSTNRITTSISPLSAAARSGVICKKLPLCAVGAPKAKRRATSAAWPRLLASYSCRPSSATRAASAAASAAACAPPWSAIRPRRPLDPSCPGSSLSDLLAPQLWRLDEWLQACAVQLVSRLWQDYNYNQGLNEARSSVFPSVC